MPDNTAAILEELEEINENSDIQSQTIQEIKEYIDDKREQEAEEKEAEEQEAEVQESQEQEAEEQEDQYIEFLTSINDQIALNNQIIAGSNVMSGVIAGVLLFTVIFNRFRV